MAVVEADVPVVGGDSSCALCAHHAAAEAKPRSDTRDDLLPWAMVLTSAVVVASVGAGVDRWFGIGAVAGIAAAAVCALLTLRSYRTRVRRAHERTVSKLAAEGDERVAMVVRQFEWAVNDVVKVKGELESADSAADLLTAQARQRERYIQKLETQLFETRERLAAILEAPSVPDKVEVDLLADAMAGIIPFLWSVHSDKYQVNLELECGVTSRRPTRVRLIDAEDNVLIVSGTPMWNEDGRPCFTLAKPPMDLITALDAGRETGYRFEALSDYDWRPVRLEDSGRRTKLVTDKQGRIYRVADEPDAVQLLVPPTTLN